LPFLRINNSRWIYLSLFLLSASILSFEIVSTPIASVIFVHNYAFIILSLAILGLGSGGIFSYYKIKASDNPFKVVFQSLFLLGVSLCVSIILVIRLSITNPFVFFPLLFLPFFFGGIVYAQVYKIYSELSHKLYASDLSGAAVGSVASLGLFSVFGGSNSIVFLALVMFGLSVHFLYPQTRTRKKVYLDVILLLFLGVLLYNDKNEFLGQVMIVAIVPSPYLWTSVFQHRRIASPWTIVLSAKTRVSFAVLARLSVSRTLSSTSTPSDL